jgi:hypothetical protein
MIQCFIECLWAQYQKDSESALQILIAAQTDAKNSGTCRTNPKKMNMFGDDPDSDSNSGSDSEPELVDIDEDEESENEESENEDEDWEFGEDGDGVYESDDIHMRSDSEYEFHDDEESAPNGVSSNPDNAKRLSPTILSTEIHPSIVSDEKIELRSDNKTAWNAYLVNNGDRQREKCGEWCHWLTEFFKPPAACLFYSSHKVIKYLHTRRIACLRMKKSIELNSLPCKL